MTSLSLQRAFPFACTRRLLGVGVFSVAAGLLVPSAASQHGGALTSHGGGPLLVAMAAPALVEPGDPQTGNDAAPLKDDLFAGTEKFAKGATDATEVNMNPDALNMVRGNNANRAHQTLLNVVHSYSYDKPGMYNPADVEEYRRKLESGDWHCSVHTRDLKTGESTDICSRRRAPDMIESAIITMEPKELTFIHTIRKVNGQGSQLGDDDPLGGVSAMPISAALAAATPRLEAQMLVLRARMAAQGTELSSHFPMADLQAQMRALRLEHLNASQEMEHLRQQLKNLQVVAPELP